MGTNGTATDALLRLAKTRTVFDLDAAALAVYGRSAVQEERNRLACIAWKLIRKGELVKAGRGRYRSAVAPDDDADTTPPITAGARPMLAYHLNRLALMVSASAAALHEEIANTRQAYNIAQTVAEREEPPAGFAVTRYASASSTVTVRPREPMS